MAFAIFGPGSLYLTRTDVANSTPINIGYCQEFNLDEAADFKELFGQNKFPLMAAVGTVKITGKAKAAMLSGIAVNNAIHGSTFSVGQDIAYLGEAGATAIPTTPFQLTVVNSATFVQDLGVINAATGLPFIKAASAPPANGYSVAAGVYTFNTADVGKLVLFSYTATLAGSGQTKTLINTPIGTNPVFQLDYATSINQAGVAKPFLIRVYSCVCSKLVRNFKLTDYMMPELDFGIYQNAAGQMYKESYPELS